MQVQIKRNPVRQIKCAGIWNPDRVFNDSHYFETQLRAFVHQTIDEVIVPDERLLMETQGQEVQTKV